MSHTPFDDERALLSDACRVLANRGLAAGILGHVSLRIDDERLLIRCRGPQERGLRYTTPEDIRLVQFDGSEAAPGELDGWSLPKEMLLHTAILRARPDDLSVVHAHPPRVVAADLAGIEIRSVLGAFDIPGHGSPRTESPSTSVACSYTASLWQTK